MQKEYDDSFLTNNKQKATFFHDFSWEWILKKFPLFYYLFYLPFFINDKNLETEKDLTKRDVSDLKNALGKMLIKKS